MIAFLSNPMTWFVGAAVVAVPLVGYVVYEAVSFHYRRKGYEPAVDMNALQDELDREFAPITESKTLRLQ